MFRLDVSHLQAHRGHNTVNKNSGEQRRHPREDTHIHIVEQDLPQGMKNRETTKYTCRQNLQENSTRHYGANTPGGDTRKLTQLSIINKGSRNIPTPTVIRQRHPTVEHPVNISALKEEGILCFSGFMLKHSLQITHSVVITFLESFS